MSRKKSQRIKLAPKTSVGEALDTLVSQFSQPLAFLRELVQNSLDAGTNVVDVRVTWAEGCAVVEVADTGEGMDRQVIDDKLTRLFASSKEGDLTKIGKFGIGFVSVFAIKPEAIVVDTGRGGEAWRLVFNPDRSFDRNRLDQPVDGTRVTVYIKTPEGAFPRFEQDCRETVSFWCRHCDVDVRFNGVCVVETFRLPGGFQLDHEEQGTHVVVAPSASSRPFYGFYNRGLTLLEGPGSPLPGVSFKCRSRYLEHTITRDNVLQDKHYEKALAIVARAAHRLLPARLAHALAANPDDDSLWAELRVVAGYPELPAELLETPFVPGLTRAYSLRELRQGPVARASEDSPLARAVLAEKVALITRFHPALAAFGIEDRPLEQYYDLAEAAEVEAELQALLARTDVLLGWPKVVPAHLYPARGKRLSLRCVKVGRAQSESQRGKVLAVEVSHPWLQSLLTIAAHDEMLAAFLLAQALTLEHQMAVPELILTQAMRGRHQQPPRTALPSR